MVAVDWDCCIADGSCIDVCPVKLYEWYRTDNDIPSVEMANATSKGDGSTNKEDRADYTDKSEPIREQDCIYCMACVAVCPTQSIKVEQSNTEFHQQVLFSHSIEKINKSKRQSSNKIYKLGVLQMSCRSV